MSRRLSYLLISVILTVSCIPAQPNGNAGKRQPRQQTRPGNATLLELPALRKGEVVTTHAGYSSSFNSAWMIPNWVAYELTAEELQGTYPRPKNSPFQPDPKYRGKQPERSDYSYSGWDKGHLAPCADMKWSEDAMLESFFFTNVCPQNHGFNEGIWQKLEERARRVARKRGSLYIVCGPVVAGNEFGTIGKNKVVIPDAFFKAFLYRDAAGYHSIAYLIPNKNLGSNFNEYALTVNELEKLLGIDLFTRLPDNVEEKVEEQLVFSDWN